VKKCEKRDKKKTDDRKKEEKSERYINVRRRMRWKGKEMVMDICNKRGHWQKGNGGCERLHG
jgi:hypothetical protein